MTSTNQFILLIDFVCELNIFVIMASKKRNHPIRYSTEIKHTAECALQRAIILSSESKLNGKNVEWLDIELPVDYSGNARGRSIDLIGKDEEGRYVLCELKFRKQYHDNGNPEEAAKQVKKYYELIKKNHSEICGHKENGKPIDWQEVTSDRTRLVVAANTSYWNFWDGKRKQGLNFDTSDVELYSIQVEESEFKEQKGSKETYIPRMSMKCKDWIKL